MQPVEARFRLRFESGPRENEWISLEVGTCSLGRLPKNTVQISDSSVSGKHAELRVGTDGVTLADLGSTNGTKVEGDRIESLLLGHGDQIQFGSVRASFHDSQMEGELPAAEAGITLEEPKDTPAPAAASAAGFGAPAASAQDTSRVSAEALARSGAGSKLGLLTLLFLLLVGGGFGAWIFLNKESGAAAAQAARVPHVAGNLLSNDSFEGDGRWTDAESASQAFFLDRSFARSGSLGLGVLLEGEEWALAASERIGVSAGKELRLSGFLSARGGAQGRLGLELFQSNAGPSVIAWARVSSLADFTEAQLNFTVPTGIKAAKVLVAARGSKASSNESEVSFDDISLVQSDGAESTPLRYEEYELSVLGEGGSSAILSRSGSILFTGIGTSSWGYDGLLGAGNLGWSASATADGFELSLGSAAAAGTRCELAANGSRPLAPDARSSTYLASLGEGGYRSHALGFKRENASHLLAGGGTNLMRFSTGSSTTLSALNRGGQPVLVLDMSGASKLHIQLGFDQERRSAEDLALSARSAAAEQRSGDALSAWTQLLDMYPIDAALIAEAEEVCGRILGQGHERIVALETSLEAADFFQLRDGYKRCRADAQALSLDYQGTEIETKANGLVARIDGALAELTSGGKMGHAERLRGVLSAIDATFEPELTARLKGALLEHKQDDEDPRK